MRQTGRCLLIFFFLSLKTPLYAETSQAVSYLYYPVSGEAYNPLLKSLEINGPGAFHAYTRWHVGWRYRYERSAKGCTLKEIEVSKTVNVTFPRWDTMPSVETPLSKEWKRYTKALKAHEQGHVKYAAMTEEAITHKLKHLKPQKNCSLMGEKANREAYKILRYYIRDEKQFDIDTQHGRKKGAVFRRVK